MLKTNLIAAAALTAAGLAGPAFANDEERQTVTVRYDDLNLASAAGRERLDTRVRVAIRNMCNAGVGATARERVTSAKCVAVANRSVETQFAALYKGGSARFASEKPPVVAAP